MAFRRGIGMLRRCSLLPIIVAVAHVQPRLCALVPPLARPASAAARSVSRLRRGAPGGAACMSAAEPGVAELPSDAVAVKVSMTDALRRHLKLPKKDRKARFFVDPANDPASNYEQLRVAVREHWGWLPDEFALRHTAVERELGGAPPTDAGESEAGETGEALGQILRCADDLTRALAAARELGVSPTFHLEAPLPERCSPPPRLKVDPAEVMADNPVARMVSFYTFKPIADPEALKAELEFRLTAVRVLGSVYVASEGINGQLMWTHWQTWTSTWVMRSARGR
ncbi:hypothetical protein T492DRAFT_846094 [Pavlovales sp. CCMP2436]|nr:hypothetical protein T492DRAFT_846094 [Pavlovales sp. CCMP2436]